MMASEKSPQQKELLNIAIAQLKERGVDGHCPRCNYTSWNADLLCIWVGTYPTDGSISLPPPMIPSLVVTCTNCGWTSIHNLQVLGVKP
jgi:hypothetical protein